VAVDEFEAERAMESENAAAAGKVFRRPQQKGIGISTGWCRAKRDGFVRFAAHFSGHRCGSDSEIDEEGVSGVVGAARTRPSDA
jgi:hypothetical protein